MDWFKEKWENENLRKWIMAVPAVLLIYVIISAMSGRSDALDERRAARAVVVETDVDVFSTDGLDELDKYQVSQMREDMAKEAKRNEDVIVAERKAMEKRTDELSKQLVESQKDVQELKKMMAGILKAGSLPNQGKSGKGSLEQQQPASTQTVNDGTSRLNAASGAYERQPTTILTRTPTAIEGNAIRRVTQRQIRSVKSDGGVVVEQMQGNTLSQKTENTKSGNIKKKEQETLLAKEFFLPAGSIMSGTLLNGVDAPTATASAEDPMPILLRIKKEAILPNHYTMDVRECHMLASSTGELSTERVRMRAEAISCILNDGRAIEKNITAYAVSSYDGKVGVRGRLVSRNGSAVARAMMAGFVSGISESSAPNRIMSIDEQPGNSSLFQKADMEDIVSTGAFRGAANAMDRLAEYYTELAENMYPFIELSAGTQVDFIVQKGMSFKLQEVTE